MAHVPGFAQLIAGDSPPAKVLLLLLLLLLLPLALLLLRRFFTTDTGTAGSEGGGGGGRKRRRRLPPSPPALPLIGHVHLVGALPHVSLRGLAERHGADGLLLVRLGAVPTLVASTSAAAQAVLRTHDQAFASRPRSVCADVLLYGPADVAMAPYGERWRLAKKLCTAHLLSARKVHSYRAARKEEVELVIGKITHAAGSAAAAVDMSELLGKFTNDIVCRAVAGRSFRVEGRDRVFRDLIDRGMALVTGFNLENLYPALARAAGGVLVAPARRKAERLRDTWDELLDKLIDEHASEMAAAAATHLSDHDAGDDGELDFIHVLLSVQHEYGLTRESIKGILEDMFAAGTDTTYLVLEFAMAELMQHRHVMAKLQDEVRNSCRPCQEEAIVVDEDSLSRMTYLKAVIKETLRLHPPAPLLIPHLSLEDCDNVADRFEVDAGTNVLVNVWAIGRDPQTWDHAEEFMPERFIRDGELGGVDFRGNDFQFLPFGSGRRMCPGMNFALATIEIMLANLVYHFDWELPQGADKIDMTEVFGLTARRKEKLLLAPRARGRSTAVRAH